MFRDSCRSRKSCSNEDEGISRYQAVSNVSAAAESGGNVTAPVLTNNTITGNVHIIHNAPGSTRYHKIAKKAKTSEFSSEVRKYKKLICSEYQYVREYNSLPGEHVLLSERFTQPLIIAKYRDQKEREEEIRSSGESSPESVHLNFLFNPDDRGISPLAVILQGNSGNGKSFTVQKIMMDWASGDLYKDQFDIAFHLRCKEINRIRGKKSLVEILSYSCSLTLEQISQMLQQSPEKVLFLVDGFDELRLTQEQDIYSMSPQTNLLQKAPPEVTLCALLSGRILPDSFLLVTTRSTATDTLSKLLKGPQRFTEIMGFSEKGVEEYFQKFFQNEEQFGKAYECVRANETLITTCAIPVICWIICTVMRERFNNGIHLTSGLETSTSIYVDFVSTLLEHHCQGLSQSVPTLLRSLGQLAEKGMMEEQVLFDEKTVYETVSDPAGSPFLCKFLCKRKIHQETMFSFMHLSFQEFFTALYYISLDGETLNEKLTNLRSSYHDTRYEAVVHFLCGLLNEDVRSTLKRKHGVFVCSDTQNRLKEIIRSPGHNERYSLFNLHCLYEFHEESFVKEVLSAKEHISICYKPLRRTDFWALMYCCQCCQSIKELTIFCCKFMPENLSMILPVLHKFERITLTPEDNCVISDIMHVITRGQTQSSLSVRIEKWFSHPDALSFSAIDLSVTEKQSWIKVDTYLEGLRSFGLTFQQSNLINFDWTNLFQVENKDVLMIFLAGLCGLKKMELVVSTLNESWANQILSLSESCSGLTEVRIDVEWILEEGIRVLQKSYIRPDCTLTFEGNKCQMDKQCESQKTCNKRVQIQLNAGGFSIRNLRPSLFPW